MTSNHDGKAAAAGLVLSAEEARFAIAALDAFSDKYKGPDAAGASRSCKGIAGRIDQALEAGGGPVRVALADSDSAWISFALGFAGSGSFDMAGAIMEKLSAAEGFAGSRPPIRSGNPAD